ncbi:PKD domain-containing protein [Algibacter sp. PT7-4]|uniref:PKD domain-containing protein n=1 Tax=Algibacter ulvanivorans TaxID=3400999 RepID=UPI003AB0D0AD
MKKHLFNLKYIALVACAVLTACVSDDLANVGDLEDITGPTPFYNLTDITTSEFDCNENELWANYEFNFQAGSNLAVNGTMYEWSVTPSEGVTLINKDLPILEQSINAQLAEIVAIEKEIAKREFKIPCETNAAKKEVLETQVSNFEALLVIANENLSDQTKQNVLDLENQITNLQAATFQDKELIFSFPGPGNYTVGLTVTDNLGKSNYTEKIITINQAVPTIPQPEIGEPSFEDNSLFDGTGDGRDSWRSPSSSKWGSVFQINTDSNPVDAPNLPDGRQAAKFPADGTRVGYQEIEVTPGATYVLTYFSAFEENTFGDLTVSIVSTNATTLEEARLEANIIATRTDNNVGRIDNVFKKHAITFEAGDNEKVIILLTNSGVESRLDAFDIVVKQ